MDESQSWLCHNNATVVSTVGERQQQSAAKQPIGCMWQAELRDTFDGDYVNMETGAGLLRHYLVHNNDGLLTVQEKCLCSSSDGSRLVIGKWCASRSCRWDLSRKPGCWFKEQASGQCLGSLFQHTESPDHPAKNTTCLCMSSFGRLSVVQNPTGAPCSRECAWVASSAADPHPGKARPWPALKHNATGTQLGDVLEKAFAPAGYLLSGYSRCMCHHFLLGLLLSDICIENTCMWRIPMSQGMRQLLSPGLEADISSIHMQQVLPTTGAFSTASSMSEEEPHERPGGSQHEGKEDERRGNEGRLPQLSDEELVKLFTIHLNERLYCILHSELPVYMHSFNDALSYCLSDPLCTAVSYRAVDGLTTWCQGHHKHSGTPDKSEHSNGGWYSAVRRGCEREHESQAILSAGKKPPTCYRDTMCTCPTGTHMVRPCISAAATGMQPAVCDYCPEGLCEVWPGVQLLHSFTADMVPGSPAVRSLAEDNSSLRLRGSAGLRTSSATLHATVATPPAGVTGGAMSPGQDTSAGGDNVNVTYPCLSSFSVFAHEGQLFATISDPDICCRGSGPSPHAAAVPDTVQVCKLPAASDMASPQAGFRECWSLQLEEQQGQLPHLCGITAISINGSVYMTATPMKGMAPGAAGRQEGEEEAALLLLEGGLRSVKHLVNLSDTEEEEGRGSDDDSGATDKKQRSWAPIVVGNELLFVRSVLPARLASCDLVTGSCAVVSEEAEVQSEDLLLVISAHSAVTVTSGFLPLMSSPSSSSGTSPSSTGSQSWLGLVQKQVQYPYGPIRSHHFVVVEKGAGGELKTLWLSTPFRLADAPGSSGPAAMQLISSLAVLGSTLYLPYNLVVPRHDAGGAAGSQAGGALGLLAELKSWQGSITQAMQVQDMSVSSFERSHRQLVESYASSIKPGRVVRIEALLSGTASMDIMARELALNLLGRDGSSTASALQPRIKLQLQDPIMTQPGDIGASGEQRYQELAAIVVASNADLMAPSDLLLRFVWPPVATRPPFLSRHTVQYLPAPASNLSAVLLRELQTVDEVWVPSTRTKTELLGSGIPPAKVLVMEPGIHPQCTHPSSSTTTSSANTLDSSQPAAAPGAPRPQEQFVMLHEACTGSGSMQQRRQADLVLQTLVAAYLSAFTASDRVTLVLLLSDTAVDSRGRLAHAHILHPRIKPGDRASPPPSELDDILPFEFSPPENPQTNGTGGADAAGHATKKVGLPHVELIAHALPTAERLRLFQESNVYVEVGSSEADRLMLGFRQAVHCGLHIVAPKLDQYKDLVHEAQAAGRNVLLFEQQEQLAKLLRAGYVRWLTKRQARAGSKEEGHSRTNVRHTQQSWADVTVEAMQLMQRFLAAAA